MKFFIIAGEASGDLHGSNLIKALRKEHKDLEIQCWGGDLMEKAGATLLKHYKELAFMGFVEVLMNIRTIFKNIKACKHDIESWEPDAIILIDYPGFNMRIAEYAHERGIKVFYYISPQVWAWKESRVHKLKKTVDRMFTILPFEKDFYAKYNFDVDFPGHPLLDVIPKGGLDENVKQDFIVENNLGDQAIIALVPGSRKQEIETMLPLMMSAVSSFPEYQFVIAGAPSIDESMYEELTQGKLKVVYGKTQELYSSAHAGLVTSGTATLEAALHNMPQVVCYKGNPISYHIGKRLVNIEYISIVNLVLNKVVVTELIQNELTSNNIKSELKKIIGDTEARGLMIENYQKLRTKLGGKGASEKTAKAMLTIMENTKR